MGVPSVQQLPDESLRSHYEIMTEGTIRLQTENFQVHFANIAIKRLD